VLAYTGTLDYAAVFGKASTLSSQSIEIVPGSVWSLMTVICILLFIGAMGKSAQFPLHVWLPDSMEGPTPISALIHAATMVTAGIFMVARMSPLFELSETALNLVLIVGGITAFFMALLGLVQNDIKRVIAYSTLSQLGYMTVALGASAYAAAIFHLVTHAFFKALLFLAAGSVIIAMHHEQDMRKMGGLYRYMPITWLTCLIGAIASIGFPGTSGFFSKDSIIEAVHHSVLPAAEFAHAMVLACVFVTALYTFRLFFMTFHGKERMDRHTWEHLHESPWVVTLPLSVLAVPSLIIGAFLVGPMLFEGYFREAIFVAPAHDVLHEIGHEWHGVIGFVLHALKGVTVYLALAGVAVAWLLYIRMPELPAKIAAALKPLHTLLVNKYWFDEAYQFLFAGGVRKAGGLLWRYGDEKAIDGVMVNGSAAAVRWFSGVVRTLQTGYLYDYAFAMIIGLLLLLAVFVHHVL
jgi:NADH-quinone oxidoreductase subunit L